MRIFLFAALILLAPGCRHKGVEPCVEQILDLPFEEPFELEPYPPQLLEPEFPSLVQEHSLPLQYAPELFLPKQSLPSAPKQQDPEQFSQEEFEWAMAFRASDGLAQYEEEAYSHLQTLDGPLELYKTHVTKFVMTDKMLAVDCSDIGGVDVGGNGWIHQSIVRGASHFHEKARFYESRACGNLIIGDGLYAADTVFEGDVKVGSNVTAERSSFQGCLTAKAEIVDLHSSCAKNIIVEATGPYYDHQVVRLAEGSVVSGDITFHSGRGRVCLDKTSSVTGKIYGGYIIPRHYWQEH